MCIDAAEFIAAILLGIFSVVVGGIGLDDLYGRLTGK